MTSAREIEQGYDRMFTAPKPDKSLDVDQTDDVELKEIPELVYDTHDM
jgi:hypothetical protein